MKYRIIEELRGDGRTVWKLQKLTRFLWIGPKVWKTWYEGLWESGWTYDHDQHDTHFLDKSKLEKQVKEWEASNKYREVLKTRIHDVDV